ncbi:stage III sporulation protein AF [Clostridium sp. 'White wine YQ']|uniref:stage III sporulation protein AF n=1 Tax=Clostridium sp. 'White wine YQ' TaxID=3027474 RepID=UPI0023654F7D|nr:stage III sporulation protein AF [Clostridium sp. 'White wine YQ']MDD7793941.1 stage III sporulation protein AF [Clostridium sp. 'White wine YQ']
MELIKEWVIDIAFTLVFMTAIEMLIVNNSFKKYVKFVLGLVLIVVLLKPILQIFGSGNTNFVNEIMNNQAKLESSSNLDNSKILNSNKETKDKVIKNLQDNANSILKKKYKDIDFESEFQGDIDLEKYNIEIKNVNIYISSKKVKPISKIKIGEEADKEEANIKEKDGIKDTISEEFGVKKDKIKVFYKS